MGVRAPQATASRAGHPHQHTAGPGIGPTLAVFLLALLALLANGRPIGPVEDSGAAALLHRLALALAGAVVQLDAPGAAIVGKLLAALFAAAAAAALFVAVAARHALDEARWAAAALALGTTLAAAAQAWSPEAPATFLVALALALLARGDTDEAPAVAARGGLPLALAAAVQPSTLPLALVLVVALVVRWPRSGPSFLAWAAAGAASGIVAIAAAGGAFPEPPPVAGALSESDAGVLALLLSPAKGALVFAPVVLLGVVGLVLALRSRSSRRWDEPSRSRMLPVACLLAVIAHLTAVAVVGGWDSAASWGPRLLAPAWPLLLLFLPEGLAWSKLAGALLVALSVAVQLVGLLAYDGRWDRLHRDAADGRLGAAAWDLGRSPLVFQWNEAVLRPALPVIERGRLRVRQAELLPAGEPAALLTFGAVGMRRTGADPTLEAVRLQQGARVDGEALALLAAGDALAFRVRKGSRIRRLELRLAGRGTGTLAVGDGARWGERRWRERTVAGPFRLRVPWSATEGCGPEVSVALRAGGPIRLESLALVPPNEPENVIRLP